MMKTLFLTIIAITPFIANSQLLLKDNFKNYNIAGTTNGVLHGQNDWSNQYDVYNCGTGAAPATNGTPYPGIIIPFTINYPNFITTNQALSIGSNSDGVGKGFTTSSPTTGTVYVAVPFIFRTFKKRTDSSAITAESNLLRMVYKNVTGDFPTTAARIFVKPNGTGFNLGVGKTLNSSTYKASPTLLNLGQTYVVVIKYTFNAGADDDQVSLYINPDFSLPEASNTPEITAIGTTDAPIIQGVNFNFNNLNAAMAYIGGVYASTNWPSIQNALPLDCVSNLQLNKTNNGLASLTWDATNCKQVSSFTVQQGLKPSELNQEFIITANGDGHYSTNIFLKDGVNFVRLITTDINGQKTYSKTLSVKNGGIIKQLQLYPNPAIDQLNVTLKADAKQLTTIQIFNKQGKLVYQHQKTLFEGENTFALDIKGFTSGLYAFKVLVNNHQSETKTFIKK